MGVYEIPVGMSMGVLMLVGGREGIRNPAHHAAEVHQPQNDQHEPHGQFHCEAEARGDDYAEKNDGGADEQNGDGMTDAPEDAYERGVADIALAADDGGYRDHVIGIGGVAHAKKKSQRNDGEKGNHFIFKRPQSRGRDFCAVQECQKPGRVCQCLESSCAERPDSLTL